MADDLNALMQRFYDAFNAGRMDEIVDELVHDDFVEHEEFPGLPSGKEGVRAFFGMMRAAFPDLRLDVEEILASGDTAAARIRMRGTHEGDFMGMPASGKQIDVPAIDWVRFREGRAIAHWGVTDTGAMMEQLGAVGASG